MNYFKAAIVAVIVAFGFVVFIKLSYFELAKKNVSREWDSRPTTVVENFGVINELSFTPLAGPFASNAEFETEPGVAIWIEADGTKILFDVGLNNQGIEPGLMARNALRASIDIGLADLVFISHAHLDHVGGANAAELGTIETGSKAFNWTERKVVSTPDSVHMPETTNVEIFLPTPIGSGLASLGPIPRQLFIGRADEQALVVNLAGKGLVLFVGCGHQTLERLTQRLSESFETPLYAIVGDLHYPFPKGRLSLWGIDAQRRLASGSGPFSPIGESEKNRLIEWAKTSGVKLFLLGHDTSDEVLQSLKENVDSTIAKVGARYELH